MTARVAEFVMLTNYELSVLAAIGSRRGKSPNELLCDLVDRAIDRRRELRRAPRTVAIIT